MNRRSGLGYVVCLGLLGCSFVDDFDKFRAADAARTDGGSADAGEDANDARDALAPVIDAADEDGAFADVLVAADVGLGPLDCLNAADGTRCGEGQICRFQACRASVCGDGFIDAPREQCDDLNQVRGDGCEPGTCRYTCELDADCDDARVCNGRERCDPASHRCASGTPASAQGLACTNAAAAAGSCQKGLCVPTLCGNGQLDPGELCEPATPDCRADCQPGCRNDADCRNNDACDGEERCEATTRECRAGMPSACVDGDACTVNGVCEPGSGCLFRLIDEDGDGYSPAGCAAASGREPDCNDANVNVWPGMTERCDAIDNDCDGQIDEGSVLSCFADNDLDGYPSREEVRRGCVCPARSIAVANPATYARWDCWDDPLDRGADVHPGQTAFFADGYGPGGRRERSYDYDCDGAASPQYPPLDGQGCTGLLGVICAQKQGFMRPTMCGETGTYVVCTIGPLACQAATDSREQACR